jgi:Domain of unknown function (DUF4375)
VTLYLGLAALMLGAILPSFAAPLSMLRGVRFLFILAVYPLFVALAVGRGLEAALLWIALAGITLLIELVADSLLPTKDSQYARWKTLLLWPVMLPAVLEGLLIHFRLAPKQPDVSLPIPPRGAQLFALPDDELLIAVYQILAGAGELTEEEQTIWLAESFSREIHCGGLAQWLSNTDDSVSDTVKALTTVGAPETAVVLREAGLEPALQPQGGMLVSPGRTEDLTSLIARYVRRNRHRCPALDKGQ